MRIVSLLPSATEIVYALGLDEELVGVTHECDFPPEARRKPAVTSSALADASLTRREIDDRDRELRASGSGTLGLIVYMLAEHRSELIFLLSL